jgi:excisionase family DNA binding protein
MSLQIPTTEIKLGSLLLLTCKQAAESTQLSVETIWDKCRSGELPHIRLSKKCYRIRRVDLEKFINSRAR